LFKVIKGIYDPACVPHLHSMELIDNSIRTRVNKFKLVQHHCHYDLRKYNFTNRVIPIWNSLSNHVVSAETVNTIKTRLDKFWSDQDRSTVRLQNRSPRHRELQYSLVCIEKVVQYIYISDIEAIEACIRFLDDDDDAYHCTTLHAVICIWLQS